MSRFTLPAILVVAALAAGCTGTYRSTGYVSATAYSPDLAYVGPGVSVVANYDEPVFYSDNYYWRYDNYGRWYRSTYYNGGWIDGTPPRAVLSIRSPYQYRHYRPQGYTVRRGYDHRDGRYYDRGRVYDRRVIRDHRHR